MITLNLYTLASAVKAASLFSGVKDVRHFPMTGVREVPLATLEPLPKTRVVEVPLPVYCAQDGCRVTLEFSDPIAASELAQAVKS